MSNNTLPCRGPMVLQCKGCHCIIGDSTAYISSNETIQIVALQTVCSITEAEMPITSRGTSDFGSTYVALSCTNCKVRFEFIYVLNLNY